MLEFSTPATTIETWRDRIVASWQKSVEAILETGRLISAAKAALPRGEFLKLVEKSLPFGARTAQRLMAIGADARLSNATHASHLPASWATLYEISRLSDDQFLARLADGTIRPEMERREAINGARSLMASRHEAVDSLDPFPTPPWASRALFEHVLPAVGVHAVPSAWEPACGEGHMAEVISEYCPVVIATDISSYGYSDHRGVDFLHPEHHPSFTPPDVDLIITNPPFGEATQFVLRALELARAGVAMFVRSQWAVEGVERYETLFRDRPPTVCAFFVERVNLCKGRWEPDGSTATAYAWVVWIKGRVPQPTFWIPPGCRKNLSRPDDVERFTAHPVIKATFKPLAIAAADGGLPPHDPETGELIEEHVEAEDVAKVDLDVPAHDDLDIHRLADDGCPHVEVVAVVGPAAAVEVPADDDDLDIPGFLRRGHPECSINTDVAGDAQC
jgi:hypothetical protein